jgi:predicted AAA+ superfamily ATPase
MNQYQFTPQVVSNVIDGFSRSKKLLQIITGPRQGKPLLIIDEIQKVPGWSGQVKALWDEDRKTGKELDVLLLGSSALLLMKGASDSLSGRFLLHRMHHWQFKEMSEAFGIGLDQWLYFGGYPGAVGFYDDEQMWKRYIRDSLIETVLSRDVLQLAVISKPALLRHLFLLSAAYPAQILSYNKMLGQLADAGNTTTLSHYVNILDSAFLLSGLELYKIGQHPKRGSSPKLVLWNSALISALSTRDFESTRQEPEWWGRIVENSVGASLLNELRGLPYELYYWRKGNEEVDYVLHTPTKTWAIEVKSSRMKSPHGLRSFLNLYPDAEPMIIGGGGMDLETFFRTPKNELFV